MRELAMHILDIAENSIRAEASLIAIDIAEDTARDTLSIEITDNGKGMDEETRRKAMDPFFSTKKVRRIGLGLPLLFQATQRTEGSFILESNNGSDASQPRGTRVQAVFKRSHIDLQPMGDLPGTLTALVTEAPEIDFVYTHKQDEKTFILDTRELRQELEGIPLSHPEVLRLIKENVTQGLAELRA